MRRRAFIAGLAGLALLPASALAERARRIAVLMAYGESDPEGRERLLSLRERLQALGWIEGASAHFDIRWLASGTEQAKVYARELVDSAPDVIIVNGSPALAAVQSLTSTIPVVFVVVTDPVGVGFVQSVSRPAGNVTGFSTFEPEIGGKWLDALTEAAPHIRRLGVLLDPRTDLWIEPLGTLLQVAESRIRFARAS
jgi:putative ABC transport system substrate-binding protein